MQRSWKKIKFKMGKNIKTESKNDENVVKQLKTLPERAQGVGRAQSRLRFLRLAPKTKFLELNKLNRNLDIFLMKNVILLRLFAFWRQIFVVKLFFNRNLQGVPETFALDPRACFKPF